VKKSALLSRIILVIALLGAFTYLAYLIFKIQDSKFSLLSFQIENAENTIVVSDVDRLVSKIEYIDEVKLSGYPDKLKSGMDFILGQDSISFNSLVSKEVMISFTASDFSIAYQDGVSFSSLSNFINDDLGIPSELTEEGKMKISGVEFFAEQFGDYRSLSTLKLKPIENKDALDYGSADYLVFNSQNEKGIRHMLSKNYHFILEERASSGLLGKTVNSESFIKIAPAKFDLISFYGSSRFTEDLDNLLVPQVDEVLSWVDKGLMYVKSGEYEFLIGREKPEASLSLILEEMTVESNNDSLTVAYFNIGKFKIQPFKATYNWASSIPELESELLYYAELNDFVVLSNSIPAMRWYLGEVQLGNLFEQNISGYGLYSDCLPNSAHHLSLSNSEDQLSCSSTIYQKNGYKLITSVQANQSEPEGLGIEMEVDFPIDISPSRIQICDEGILLNNLNAVQLYSKEGEQKWSIKLSSDLVDKPQIVDFENDGINEYVLFQRNELDVVNSKGKSLIGFPVSYSGDSKAGLAVNYDNLFNYRLIVSLENTVKVYDESGEIVEGWMFEGMTAPIKSKIYHVLTSGKDIIAFKDANKQQYILNRKGETRLEEQISFELPNETDFVVGGMESSLRKMGYADGYIYNYYVLDGQKDSIKMDQFVLPTAIHWEFNNGNPLLIIEETERLLIADQFGYIKSEVLKPKKTNMFVGLVGNKEYGFVFSDNSQNNIYLLNNFGKMMLPKAVQGSSVCTIEGDLLYTYSGINIKAYKIKD
jgi:hypothetical protein